jgi:hypothetical protein
MLDALFQKNVSEEDLPSSMRRYVTEVTVAPFPALASIHLQVCARHVLRGKFARKPPCSSKGSKRYQAYSSMHALVDHCNACVIQKKCCRARTIRKLQGNVTGFAQRSVKVSWNTSGLSAPQNPAIQPRCSRGPATFAACMRTRYREARQKRTCR